MARVHVLPPEIISKIAAGEVIERPASVVKELLENSLDAGTSSLEINITNAGKTRIEIKDTGSGIDAGDIEKIFLRHSTSKISTVDDLYSIASLGFRGEALYSVAAVSDITVKSTTASQDSGWEIHIRGGEKISLHPSTIPTGTHIEIRELFFNTPARKKFLKSDTTEMNQIIGAVIPYTLIYPGVHFVLSHNKRNILDLPPVASQLKRICQTLSIEEKHITEANYEYREENVNARLFLGDINIKKVNRSSQFIFVNNRPVQNKQISFQINQAYRLIFPEGTNPVFIVCLTIPPGNVDVNVHPSKKEVKIKNENLIASFLRAVCEKNLMEYGKAKQLHNAPFKLPEKTEKYASSTEKPWETAAIKEFLNAYDTPRTSRDGTPDIPAQKQTFFLIKDGNLKNKLAEAEFIGQFKNKYLFFETADSLLVMDQHAGHERVTYERLNRQVKTGKVEIQHLLAPILIKVNQQEMLRWEENNKTLEKIGLLTTLWDKETIALHACPHAIDKPETAIMNVLSEEEISTHDLDMLIRRACRQSIMVGDRIHKEQAEALRKQLLECDDPFTCPHGRPTVIEIQENYLSRQFLR